jgi:hypothetical protein
VVLLAPLGCAHVDLLAWARSVPEASEKNPVFNIVSVWEPSEGRNTDGLPTRGFAGQLFFFTRSSPTPVKVNGDVRVYVFDDQGTAEEQAKPIHQFDFLGDAWTMHLQDSTLGPSYNVFIPYTREGQWQANCQLRLRLSTESGQVVHSEMVEVALPGSPRPGGQDATPSGGTASPPPVGQHLATQMRPPVEPIQYGATLRHETVRHETARPMVVSSGSPPMTANQVPAAAMPAPAMSAAAVSAATMMAESAPKRFRLSGDATAALTAHNTRPAANNTRPAANNIAPAAYNVGPSSPPRSYGTNLVGRAGGSGPVPGNWPQIGRPVIPTASTGQLAVVPAGMTNEPPQFQSFPYQAPAPQAVSYQPVVYQVEADGPTITGTTSTLGGGAAGGNTGVAHPLGSQAAVRHPLANALQ